MSSYLSESLSRLQEACRTYDQAKGTDREGHAEKHRLIIYGVAALTLDAARADQGLALPDPITTETDQFVALAYMLRCAPAHDIASPVWKIKNRYQRAYEVGPVKLDLSNFDGQPFEFNHIGGPQTLIALADYAQQNGWA